MHTCRGGCSSCSKRVCWECFPEQLSDSPIAVTFGGPLVMQDNSKPINNIQPNTYNTTGKVMALQLGPCVQAENTLLRVKGPTTIIGHMQGAVHMWRGTAQFLGAFTARNNQGIMLWLAYVRANFHSSFVCDQDARPSQAVPAPSTERTRSPSF